MFPTASSETTPLIPGGLSRELSSSTSDSATIVFRLPDQAIGNQESDVGRAAVVGVPEQLDFKLFVSLLWDSIPVILSYILQNSIQTASIVIAGRLGPNELSVAAFSLMLAFVTGWIVALGGTTALDTLGSQAFTGGSRPTDLSVHFQRCVILLWVLLIPVCFLWAYIERVLLAFGQPAHLARDVQVFLRVLIIGAPGYVGFESLKKYLQCQGIMGASTTILILVSPFNIALNIFLVHYTSLGILGSPLAVSSTYWLCFISLGIYTSYSGAHKQNGTWGGLQLRAALNATGCYEFLKLALPGILMVGTEWAAFEIVALAAGRLERSPCSAVYHYDTDQILNTIPFGIGVAASAPSGNLIGARSPVGAKLAAHASALLSVIVGSVVMLVMLVAKDVFGLLFSDDVDVVKLVSKVMPLVASFQVADGLAGSCGGVLRGQGRQHLGAFFQYCGILCFGSSTGITLAFHEKTKLGLQGLWIGQVVALFIVGIGEYCVVWLGTDWNLEVQKAVERNEREGKRAVRDVAVNPRRITAEQDDF